MCDLLDDLIPSAHLVIVHRYSLMKNAGFMIFDKLSSTFLHFNQNSSKKYIVKIQLIC